VSISSALSNAISGLSTVSRTAEAISNNVANAQTEGYSRQQVTLASRVAGGQGGGVLAKGISRAEDHQATLARRASDATKAAAEIPSRGLKRLADALGTPGAQTALTTKYQQLFNNFIALHNAPDSVALQQKTLDSAKDLASAFHSLANLARSIREETDKTVGAQVATLNDSLAKIVRLNVEIRNLAAAGSAPPELLDRRASLIDGINKIIPVRQVPNGRHEISLFATGGAVLLNGSPRHFDFNVTGTIDPSMSMASGALSGLTLAGQPVNIDTPNGAIGGGALSAAFHLRDEILPDFQNRIDALALDLADRFQSPAVDPTLSAGQPGLFTDAETAANPANLVGLSARIDVNFATDPSQNGQLWRLRAGLNATSPGQAGNGVILENMSSAMSSTRAAPAQLAVPQAMDAAGFAAEITSIYAQISSNQQESLAFINGHNSNLKKIESGAIGVDTDREMQDLLKVKEAYAANARVISVIDSLITKLLEI